MVLLNGRQRRLRLDNRKRNNMSKVKTRYEELNEEVVAGLKRMDEACERKDTVAVEVEDKKVAGLIQEMRAEMKKC